MQGAPYYYRYNPVAAAWVCVGPRLPEPQIRVPAAPKKGNRPTFETVQYPGHRFVIEPDTKERRPPETLLYKEQPPVGEHYAILGSGLQHVFEWDARLWEQWLEAVQYRLVQLYHNPFLHNVKVLAPLRAHEYDEVFPVGEIIATSHPIAGGLPCIEHDIVHKLRTHEKSFILFDTAHTSVRVASAPLADHELWVIPQDGGSCFEQAPAKVRKDVSTVLATLVRTLHEEFSRNVYALEIVTSLQHRDECSWWIRISKEESEYAAGTVPVREYPEILLHKLKVALRV